MSANTCFLFVVSSLLVSECSATSHIRFGPVRGKRAPDEQKLIKQMFLNYDKSVRPVLNASDSVTVKFGVTLIQVMDMDERNQVLVTNVWLEHEWYDQRLTWDPDVFHGVTVIRIPPAEIWKPDITLYNNADDYKGGYMPANVVLRNNGLVYWSPPARLKSSCKVDITYFPFDTQICKMKFGSWTYPKSQIDIVGMYQEIDRSNYITNGEWSLMDAYVIRNEIVYPISDEIYPDVTAYIKIRRLIVYYILNIICPCVWLNILSLLAFILPPDSGEKVALGITVLLSYSVFMLLVAEDMPSTSEFVPLIGIYLTTSMAVTSISVILTVCVLKLHHGGPVHYEVPQWLRTFVLVRMAGFLRCDLQCLRSSQKKRNARSTVGILDITNDISTKLDQFQPTPGLDFQLPHAIRHGKAFRPECELIAEDILSKLKVIVSSRDEGDQEEEIRSEWQQVAQIIDRFLFYFFLVCTTICTGTLVVIVPLFTRMSP